MPYAVFPHAVREQQTHRGMVVRPCDDAGVSNDHYNYRGIKPATGKRYKHWSAAQKAADLLNAQAAPR